MWLFLLFLAVPLIEIALFIQVGGAIGLVNTLVVVVATAILGTFLVRQQGAQVLQDLRAALDQFTDPSEPLVHGAMILFAGALLLTPGFFTDALGLSLLIPGVRVALFRRIAHKMVIVSGRRRHAGAQAGGQTRPHAGQGPVQGDVIDGAYEVVQPPERPDSPDAPPSGWTKH